MCSRSSKCLYIPKLGTVWNSSSYLHNSFSYSFQRSFSDSSSTALLESSRRAIYSSSENFKNEALQSAIQASSELRVVLMSVRDFPQQKWQCHLHKDTLWSRYSWDFLASHLYRWWIKEGQVLNPEVHHIEQRLCGRYCHSPWWPEIYRTNKKKNQSSSRPCIPIPESLFKSTLWWTVSKAFFRSRKTAPVRRPLLMLLSK